MNEDKATRYNRLKRQVGVASMTWGALLLLGLVVSGGSVWLREVAEGVASALAPEGWLRSVSVVVYVVLLTLLNELRQHAARVLWRLRPRASLRPLETEPFVRGLSTR